MAVETVGVGAQGVVAPNHHGLGYFVVGVVIAVGEVLRAIGHGVAAAGGGHAGDAGQVACHARQPEAGIGGRAVGPGDARDPRGDVAPGSRSEDDRFGSVLLADLDEFAGYEVYRLIPTDALPFVLAAILRIALHGVEQAVFVVHDLRQIQAAHAQAPLVEGVLGIALHLHQACRLCRRRARRRSQGGSQGPSTRCHALRCIPPPGTAMVFRARPLCNSVHP